MRKSKLHCEITNNYTGDQVLNNNYVEKSNIINVLFTYTKDGLEYKLYRLHCSNSFIDGFARRNDLSKIWHITVYKVKDAERVSSGFVKIDYNIANKFIGHKDDISEFIKQLIDHYSYGRVFSYMKGTTSMWYLAPDLFGRNIYYKQAKKILEFESKSITMSTENVPALHLRDPRLIEERIDFGNYCLEAWNGGRNFKKNYSYVAFSKAAYDWVEKICRQVNI